MPISRKEERVHDLLGKWMHPVHFDRLSKVELLSGGGAKNEERRGAWTFTIDRLFLSRPSRVFRRRC